MSDDASTATADQQTEIESAALCRKAGITYRQLDTWCRSGILEPTQPALGSGTKRIFARSEVRLACVLRDLSNLGLLGAMFEECAAQLRTRLPMMDGSGWAIVELLDVQRAHGGNSVKGSIRLRTVERYINGIDNPSWVVPIPSAEAP